MSDPNPPGPGGSGYPPWASPGSGGPRPPVPSAPPASGPPVGSPFPAQHFPAQPFPAQPAGVAWRPPKRVEPVPGTPFALAYLEVPRATSGLAVGALVAGVGSLIGVLLVACFGALGSQADVGALVGGAFAVLAGLLGAAGIFLGVLGRREAGRTGARGRGMAIAGIACAASGIGLTLVVLVLLLLG